MINLEDPKKFQALVEQAHQVAMNMLRPISRKYDLAEHEYPKELDMLAAMIDGLAESGASEGAGATGVRRDEDDGDTTVKNGTNLASVMSVAEMCWGDVGLLLSMPRQGLGNSAIASVADDEQLERFDGVWAAMAITEPEFGSDSAQIRTTAVKDGDHYVLNGEKIFVTSGDRADHVVVWATLDKDLGRAAIKSFVVAKGTPGMEVERLEHKLGIRGIRHRDDPVRELPRAGREPARLTGDRHQAGLRRGDGDVRQHPAAGRRHGRRLRPGLARPDPRAAPAGGHRGRLRPPGPHPGRRGRPVPADGGRLGGGVPAHPAGGLDGRQPPAQLAGGVHGQGQGRPGRLGHHARLRRALRVRSATARPSCWRSGRATRRSSTSSKAPSRSSS